MSATLHGTEIWTFHVYAKNFGSIRLFVPHKFPHMFKHFDENLIAAGNGCSQEGCNTVTGKEFTHG